MRRWRGNEFSKVQFDEPPTLYCPQDVCLLYGLGVGSRSYPVSPEGQVRVLNASVLASLLAIVTPPESGAVYFKGDFLHVGTGIPKSMPVASFDLARLAQLIQAYIEMPGIPEVK